MIIKVNDKQIHIVKESNDVIYPYIFAQLEYFGFKQLDITYTKNCINLENDLKEVVDFFKQEDINLNFSKTSIDIIERYKIKASNFNELLDKAKSIKKGNITKTEFFPFIDFLSTLPRKLKDHQIKAAFHLYLLKNGANFSVPGSGKTSVVLSVYEKLKNDDKVNVLFVVGPPASFQPWQNEFKETLGRIPSTTILAGGNQSTRKNEYYTISRRASELYLTTFQTILKDYKEVMFFFNQIGLHPYFVIDEAHYMKQIGGSWANALLEISNFSKYRCILTGTPMPKSFKDIFNLFDFLFPANEPLTESDKIQIDIWEKGKKNDLVKNLLLERIGPLFYRVRKKDLDLRKPSFHPPIIISMNKHEQRIYDLIKSKIHQLSTDDYIYNEDLLMKLWKGRMIRLRQCISYPKLMLKNIKNYEEDILIDNTDLLKLIRDYDNLELPAKLQVLITKIEELTRHNQKVVIWSNFVQTLKLIKKQLKMRSFRCELIYGGTPIQKSGETELLKEKTREEIRNEFVNPNSGLDILIANPAAASESISLHKTCFHAIYYDLSYNAAQYLQSLDRIHRVGGSETNTANYYFLQYENSIDQDIKNNLEAKASKMYSIIEEDYEIYNLDMFEESQEDDIAAYKRLFHSH